MPLPSVIPTRNRYCLNLATAVATILWHRAEQLGELTDGASADGIGHDGHRVCLGCDRRLHAVVAVAHRQAPPLMTK